VYKDRIRLEFPKLFSVYDPFSLILSLSRVNVDFHKLKWMSGNEIAVQVGPGVVKLARNRVDRFFFFLFEKRLDVIVRLDTGEQ
jgi:hypothetical protein